MNADLTSTWYTCPACGEPIEVAVDPTAGGTQEYVVDCEVCCNPLVLTVHWPATGSSVRVTARREAE